ncbi:SdiA-regulated domain-containing protein [Mesonia sp. K7]|uniref:SdiA-regulated domain-containing protein n=1 Tax=Mesonia sp. K7 TaxID=2218606 RepID=UPI000DA7EDEB|nr:SdiA-regulated domain-containing protein [Mesonia sp. K7]PZD79313.1 hypothetical protein DNG35_02170 [Mesonia sp. K7]
MSYFKSPPFYITLVIMVFVSIMYFTFKDKYVVDYDNPSKIEIANKWTLPSSLDEISGIAFVDKNHMACIQDEAGEIFIYNLTSGEVVKTIKFGDYEDYEGIAIVGKDAFVARSDGKIYEVKNFMADNIEIKTYQTPLTKEDDLEGLCYDKNTNSLWLACKESPDRDKLYKPIYRFDLASKKMMEEPIYKLKFDDPIFKDLNELGNEKTFRTSEIGIHPKTGDIYMVDGAIPKLLILNKKWEAQKLIVFDPDEFAQPEGIAFDDENKLYISNEGEWKNANILKVEIEEDKKNEH